MIMAAHFLPFLANIILHWVVAWGNFRKSTGGWRCRVCSTAGWWQVAPTVASSIADLLEPGLGLEASNSADPYLTWGCLSDRALWSCSHVPKVPRRPGPHMLIALLGHPGHLSDQQLTHVDVGHNREHLVAENRFLVYSLLCLQKTPAKIPTPFIQRLSVTVLGVVTVILGVRWGVCVYVQKVPGTYTFKNYSGTSKFWHQNSYLLIQSSANFLKYSVCACMCVCVCAWAHTCI